MPYDPFRSIDELKDWRDADRREIWAFIAGCVAAAMIIVALIVFGSP